MDAASPLPAETGTFIELMEVGGEWYVRVVVEGRETINWFQSKARALDFTKGWRRHLNLEKIPGYRSRKRALNCATAQMK